MPSRSSSSLEDDLVRTQGVPDAVCWRLRLEGVFERLLLKYWNKTNKEIKKKNQHQLNPAQDCLEGDILQGDLAAALPASG